MTRQEITSRDIKLLLLKIKFKEIFGVVTFLEVTFSCPMCGGNRYWYSKGHKKVCLICHPPMNERDIEFYGGEE